MKTRLQKFITPAIHTHTQIHIYPLKNMARLGKPSSSSSSLTKKSSATLGKKTSTLLSSKTERRPGLKTQLLARDVNEFLHAPKATKKEKKEVALAEVVEKAKLSSTLAAAKKSAGTGRVGKDGNGGAGSKKKAEKQKRKREAQATKFNSAVQGLLDGLPDLQALQQESEDKNKKREQDGLVRVKQREQVIRLDKMAFQRNMAANMTASTAGGNDEMVMVGEKMTSAASPLARLGAIRQQLAKSMGKEMP